MVVAAPGFDLGDGAQEGAAQLNQRGIVGGELFVVLEPPKGAAEHVGESWDRRHETEPEVSDFDIG